MILTLVKAFNVPVHRAAVLQCGRDKHRPLIGRLEGHRPQVEVGDFKAKFGSHVSVQSVKKGIQVNFPCIV